MRDILDSRYATTNDVTHTHIYIEFIYRVYRFRPCILNSYDTLWLRNAIFLRLSIELTITLQLVNRGAMKLRCSNLMVWTGYYGLQRPIHRGRKAFRRIVANNRGWVTTKSERATSKRYEIAPCTVRNLCAPLLAHTIAHARLPCAGRVGANRRGGVPLWPWFAQSKALFRDCLRKNDAVCEANRGLVQVFTPRPWKRCAIVFSFT